MSNKKAAPVSTFAVNNKLYAIWNKIKYRLSDEDLKALAEIIPSPYSNWAKDELEKRVIERQVNKDHLKITAKFWVFGIDGQVLNEEFFVTKICKTKNEEKALKIATSLAYKIAYSKYGKDISLVLKGRNILPSNPPKEKKKSKQASFAFN